MSFADLGGVCNGGWRGALRVAQCQAPLRCEGLGKLGGRLPSKSGMWAFRVIVVAPCGEHDAGVIQGREQGFIQEFVAQSTIEAFDEGILGRLSGRDVVPVKLAVIGLEDLHQPLDPFVGKLLPPKLLKRGDQVTLTKGPFANFVAEVESIAPDRRVWVLMEIMGAQTRVAVGADQLRTV